MLTNKMRDQLMKQAETELNRVNIVEYVRDNYDALPKSNFNDQELVVVLEIRNDDEGWGNHSYSGVGVDRDGKIWYCFSSGCSCNGSCGIEGPHGHDLELKKFEVDGQAFDLTDIDADRLQHIQVSFSDY
jgi:hypothetical protein